MPAYRKLPPIEEIERMYQSGMTYKEIGAAHGVSVSAVSKEMSRKNRTPKKITYHDLLPWRILPEHTGTAIMRRVRTLALKRQGIAVSEDHDRLLAEWISGMAESGLVLNYHPEAPPNAASSAGGFYYSPRRDGEEGLCREVE